MIVSSVRLLTKYVSEICVLPSGKHTIINTINDLKCSLQDFA